MTRMPPTTRPAGLQVPAPAVAGVPNGTSAAGAGSGRPGTAFPGEPGRADRLGPAVATVRGGTAVPGAAGVTTGALTEALHAAVALAHATAAAANAVRTLMNPRMLGHDDRNVKGQRSALRRPAGTLPSPLSPARYPRAVFRLCYVRICAAPRPPTRRPQGP